MQKQLETTTVTVPVPLHASLRRGTLASIVRQSELARSLFETELPRPILIGRLADYTLMWFPVMSFHDNNIAADERRSVTPDL